MAVFAGLSSPSLEPSHLVLLASATVIAALWIRSSLYPSVKYPPTLPRVREKPGATSFSLSTRLAYYTDCEQLYRDAYDNYGSKGKSVLVPGVGSREEVVLPNSAFRWILSQPEKTLSSPHAMAEYDQFGYTLGSFKYVLDPWQSLLIKKDLNAVLETVMVSLKEELGIAFDEQFGTDTDEWREVDLLQSIQDVITQASGRFVVGLPLCRDKEFQQSSLSVIDYLVNMAGGVVMIPELVRPILAPVVAALLGKPTMNRFHGKLKPVFEERMESIRKRDATSTGSPSSQDQGKPDDGEPRDLLQMIIRYGLVHRPSEMSFENISIRVGISMLASVHQTKFAAINMILHVLDSDAAHGTVAALRKEMAEVLGDGGTARFGDARDAEWTRLAVSRMIKADSIARETLRLPTFGNRAMMRRVMVDGVVTEDGVELPRGALVSVLMEPGHRGVEDHGQEEADGNKGEESTSSEPSAFDPFRFSRVREAKGGAGGLAITSTGESFLPFGHGKHACPGRFLLDYELKMILAFVFWNYDVEFPAEYGGKRPESPWMAEVTALPKEARVRVRRRKRET